MTTASRSHKLKARVQRIEAALPPLEKAILAQTSHIHFAYTAGMALYLCFNLMDLIFYMLSILEDMVARVNYCSEDGIILKLLLSSLSFVSKIESCVKYCQPMKIYSKKTISAELNHFFHTLLGLHKRLTSIDLTPRGKSLDSNREEEIEIDIKYSPYLISPDHIFHRKG